MLLRIRSKINFETRGVQKFSWDQFFNTKISFAVLLILFYFSDFKLGKIKRDLDDFGIVWQCENSFKL